MVRNNSSREQATGEGDIAMPITPAERPRLSASDLRSLELVPGARDVTSGMNALVEYIVTLEPQAKVAKLFTQTSGKKLPTNRNSHIEK